MGWLNYRIHYWHASLSHSIPHHHGQYVKQSLQNTNIHMHNLPADIGRLCIHIEEETGENI